MCSSPKKKGQTDVGNNNDNTSSDSQDQEAIIIKYPGALLLQRYQANPKRDVYLTFGELEEVSEKETLLKKYNTTDTTMYDTVQQYNINNKLAEGQVFGSSLTQCF